MEPTVLPARIGPYAIKDKLGAGGMGTVYLGRHDETGELVAVKVLSASLAREDGIIERFLREIDAMRQLGGPHIVKLFDSGTDLESGQLYYAMEYVAGETLTDRIRAEKRLPWEQAVDIALQVCSALKVAHAAGIVHRDLKPSNLLIGNNGVVKLTDFGVAQLFAANRLTSTGGIIGTAEYMSPEQSLGQRATKKSDLYSLGAVIYVMVTGRPPFTGKTSIDIIRKHSTANFDLPTRYEPGLPRSLEELICKLLAKNPDDRIPDAHIVALRLKEVVKRVEFANDANEVSETAIKDAFDLAAPTAVTKPGDNDLGETKALAHGPGPATMVRDLFRVEIERSAIKSPLAKFFDNTLVLVTLLLLIIGSTVWWLTSNPSSNTGPEEPTAADADNEVERLLRLAGSHRRAADVVREGRVLRALRILIASDESKTKDLEKIDQRLTELSDRRLKETDDYQLARDSLSRAKALRASGADADAQLVLQSLIDLYEGEPGAHEIVQEAKVLRR